MTTHPWFQARAEYLAAHAPVVDQPSILGDVELNLALEDAPNCEVDHHAASRARRGSAPSPVCMVEVVALIGCRNCGTLLACENGRAWLEGALLQSPSPVCGTCGSSVKEVWWWRLI